VSITTHDEKRTWSSSLTRAEVFWKACSIRCWRLAESFLRQRFMTANRTTHILHTRQFPQIVLLTGRANSPHQVHDDVQEVSSLLIPSLREPFFGSLQSVYAIVTWCQPVTRSAYPKFHRMAPSLFKRGGFRCEGAENGQSTSAVLVQGFKVLAIDAKIGLREIKGLFDELNRGRGVET